MNLVGRVIGNRYEIIEKIGEGGMATVYKAKCNILKRYVAVKVLRDEFTTDEEFIKRFNTEAQSAASLTHPNIVSIYDVGHEENIYYIVMELVQGKTLKDIINEDGTLPWKWALNVSIQVASALEMAHRNSIVHRDIKPHNIIITEDGIAKVTDFGIAKAVSNSTITAFGTTIGSVHYFSPCLLYTSMVCPKCYSKLEYDYVRYHHIGKAHCPNCDYKTCLLYTSFYSKQILKKFLEKTM